MQSLMKIPFVRNQLYARAATRFVQEQETRGILLRNETVAERLTRLRTVLVDDALVMERDFRVRRITAPVTPCDLQHLKHQGSWMVLMAAVALGSIGFAPMEALARSMNFEAERMEKQYPQVHMLAYDPERRMETTVHRDRQGLRAYTKGDVDVVLDRCTALLDGKERPLTYNDRCLILREALEMERLGLISVAFATRWLPSPGAYESEMVFLGIVGMGDVPRPEASQAMEAMREAGIRPVLVSESEMTPGSVRACGVLRETTGLMRADEMDSVNDARLREMSEHVDAFTCVDWRRRARLSRVLRRDGTVGTLGHEPQSGGLVLAIGDGTEPDVVLEQGGIRGLIRLLNDCQGLQRAYQPTKQRTGDRRTKDV